MRRIRTPRGHARCEIFPRTAKCAKIATATLVTLAKAWFLYVLRCADGTLYTGVTTDLARREDKHNAGKGARYTAGRRPVALVAAWRFPDRRSAQRAEARFRRLPRARKLALVAQRRSFEDAPFCCGNEGC